MNIHILGTVVSHPSNTTSESWTHFYLLHLHHFTERMTVTCFRQMYATPSGLLTIHSWFQTTTWSQSNGATRIGPILHPLPFSRGQAPFQRQGAANLLAQAQSTLREDGWTIYIPQGDIYGNKCLFCSHGNSHCHCASQFQSEYKNKSLLSSTKTRRGRRRREGT